MQTLSGVILRHKPKNNKWNEEIFAHHRDYDIPVYIIVEKLSGLSIQ